jgi:CheY-specific phosphatase CheX
MTCTATVAAAVDHAVAEVLETMFFAEPEPAAADAGPGDETVSSACLNYRGVVSGTLRVHLSADAARRLACDFLGSEDPPPAEVAAVVREMANMICGAVLSRLHTEAAFELSAPVSCDGAAPGPDALVRRFDLGGGVLRVTIG